jgi:uncharacterized protein
MEVINNRDKNQFELQIEGHQAIIEYKIKKDKIYLISTQVPDALSGQGIGKKLVTGTIDQIETMNLKVVPVCSFIQAWFKRNPDKNNLLA